MNINYELPIIDLNKIKQMHEVTPTEEDIILGVMYSPVGGVGVLRATRQKDSPYSSWVWRKIMLLASPEEKFHCLATSLDEYIHADNLTNSEYVALVGELDIIVNKVVSSLDETTLPGMLRWKKANGIT